MRLNHYCAHVNKNNKIKQKPKTNEKNREKTLSNAIKSEAKLNKFIDIRNI